jgi:hypothetical protein
MADKFEADIRHSVEFILRVKGVYTEADLMRKDYMTFFKMLQEAEDEEMDRIKRMEQANKG